jgi:hypothetical protein
VIVVNNLLISIQLKDIEPQLKSNVWQCMSTAMVVGQLKG